MDLKQPVTRPINFQVPFRHSHKGGFATNDTTVDAVADDLKILIKTNWGERVIHYDFGANLRALLFNPSADIQQQITDSISVAVEKWLPYVSILDITVQMTEDNPLVDYNHCLVKITFGVGNTGMTGKVQVNI